MIFSINPIHFEFTHKFEDLEWAPGVWAGTEGLTFEVSKVDLENKIITLSVKFEE